MPKEDFYKDFQEGMPRTAAHEIYDEELGADFVDKVYNEEKGSKQTVDIKFEDIVQGLKSVGEKIDLLPKEFPEIHIPEAEFPKEIKVSNLSELPKFPKIPEFPSEIEVKKPKWLPKPEKVDLSNVEKLLFGVKTAFSTLFGQISTFFKKNILRIRIEEQKEPLETHILDKEGNIIDDFKPRVSVSGGGGGGADIVRIKDIVGSQINPAKEDGNLAKALGLSGSGVDTTFTLTNDNTAYTIPSSPPTDFYTLLICNVSDTDIYFRFTTGVTAGVKIASDATLSIDLGANQQVYVYCGVAGKIINLSYKII